MKTRLGIRLILGTAFALIVAAAPLAARANPYGCNAGTNVAVSSMLAPACSFTAECPPAHPGDCVVDLDVTAYGTGVVGVRNSAGVQCGPAVGTCSASAYVGLSPGNASVVLCAWSGLVAYDSVISCTATVF
jgi:hypothetical protein